MLLTIGHVGPPLPCNLVKLVDVAEMNYLAVNGEGEVCVCNWVLSLKLRIEVVFFCLFLFSQLSIVSGC